jgi:ankyrin repeat domain-containing protein 50
MLCSLITDICSNRRDTPTALQKAYDHENHGQQRPTTASLVEMLKAVMEGFESVYLIVDAVDECPKSDGERLKFLEVLNEIFSWQLENLHIFLTSRREIDVVATLDELPKNLGQFQVIEVGYQSQGDITKYLNQRLQDRQFARWTSELKQEVSNELSSQADGIYVDPKYLLDFANKIGSDLLPCN